MYIRYGMLNIPCTYYKVPSLGSVQIYSAIRGQTIAHIDLVGKWVHGGGSIDGSICSKYEMTHEKKKGIESTEGWC